MKKRLKDQNRVQLDTAAIFPQNCELRGHPSSSRLLLWPLDAHFGMNLAKKGGASSDAGIELPETSGGDGVCEGSPAVKNVEYIC